MRVSMRFGSCFQFALLGAYSHTQCGCPVFGTLLPISKPTSRGGWFGSGDDVDASLNLKPLLL